MLRKNVFASMMLIVVLIAMTGCASVNKPYEKPVPEIAAEFEMLDSNLVAGGETTPQWWTLFGDPILVDLIEDGLANNLDLAEAVSRVEAARAFQNEASQAFLPSGGLGADQQHAGVAGERTRTAAAGIEAGWEIDLFGRIRSLNRAAVARAEEVDALLGQTRIVVASEIARTYHSYRASRERIVMLEGYAADQREIIGIIGARVEEGLDDEGDLARARTVAAEDALALSQERHRSRLYASALAVLTGQSPIEFAIPEAEAAPVLALETIAIGDPASLLARRPDVRAAERDLAAQTAEIGIATAGLFPQVRLGGVFSFVAGSFGDLGRPEGESWLAGPSVSWGIFDLSRVRAQIRRERTEADGALAAYERTVLRALEDAQNAFSGYASAQESLVSSDDLVRNARTAAEIVELQYEEGMVAYFDYLDARRTAVRAELGRIDAISGHRLATVDVFRALGVER